VSAATAAARVALRLLDAGDSALYAALYGDPATMQYVAAARDPAQLQRGFAATCRANAATPPRRRVWVIFDPGDGQPLGLIGLVWDRDTEAGRQGAELGVMLPPARQGLGLATSAIAALRPLAFAQLGLDFLHTWHRDEHGLAGGLMAKAGFAPQPGRDGERGQRWRLEPAAGERGRCVSLHAPRRSP
jgi:RimJ/RimL family protein N-acetyltransferase